MNRIRLANTINMSVLLALILCVFAGCKDDDTFSEIEIKDLEFTATNLSDRNATSANSLYENILLEWNVIFNINGENVSFTGVSKKNVLPVMAGNEIEVSYTTQTDNFEITYTLPDGSTRVMTKAQPSFKWIVPQTIKTGDRINGEMKINKGGAIYKTTGQILFEVVR